MLPRQLTFAAITTAYIGFWLYLFWPTIALAVEKGDVGSLGAPAVIIGLVCAVAVLMPMSSDRPRSRRLPRLLALLATGSLGLLVYGLFFVPVAARRSRRSSRHRLWTQWPRRVDQASRQPIFESQDQCTGKA
jgi:hypothetical protein